MPMTDFLNRPKTLPSVPQFIDDGKLRDRDVIYLEGHGGRSRHVYKRERDEKALAIIEDCSLIRAVWSPGLYKQGIFILIDAVERNGKIIAQGQDCK